MDTNSLQNVVPSSCQTPEKHQQNENEKLEKPAVETDQSNADISAADRNFISNILDSLTSTTKQSTTTPPPKAQEPAQSKRHNKSKNYGSNKRKLQNTQKAQPSTSESMSIQAMDFDQLMSVHELIKENAKRPLAQDEVSSGNVNHPSPSQKAKRPKKQESPSSQNKKKKHNNKQDNTPICNHWKLGRCAKGDQCKFRHEGPQDVAVCRFFKSNSCFKGDNCPFAHELNLEPCRFYHVKGVCDAGPGCPFSHEPLTPLTRKSLHAMTGPCRFYHFKGYCNNGDECLFSHTSISEGELSKLEKTLEPCVFYHVKGHCNSGNDCFYLHDEAPEEARTKLLEKEKEHAQEQENKVAISNSPRDPRKRQTVNL